MGQWLSAPPTMYDAIRKPKHHETTTKPKAQTPYNLKVKYETKKLKKKPNTRTPPCR